MRMRRLPLALGLALLAGGGIAAVALQDQAGSAPETLAEPDYSCTTCDARAASKKRSREALQAKSAKGD